MLPSVEKILKFFSLEKEKHFNNRAIIGGLDKILGNWLYEAKKDHLPEALISSVKTGLENYASISPEARQTLLDELTHEFEAFSTDQANPSVKQEALAAKSVPPIETTNPPLQSMAPRERIANQPAHRQTPQKEFPGLKAPVTVLNGIGPQKADLLSSIGIKTIQDLLYYFPRRYDDYSKLKPINRVSIGDELTIIATVQSASIVRQEYSNMTRIEVVVSDGTDFMRLIFFRRGKNVAEYYQHQFHRGAQLVISGKVTSYLGRKQMVDPEYEPLDNVHLNTNGIIPVYPLTAGLTQDTLRKAIHDVINFYAPKVPEYLPENMRSSAHLADLPFALRNIHYPDSQESLKAAIDRLAFDEIFFLQLVCFSKNETGNHYPQNASCWMTSSWMNLPINSLTR